MYNQSSLLICAILFMCMLIAIEVGYRLGFRIRKRADASYKSHIDALQSSLLSILALLIAFTFNWKAQTADLVFDPTPACWSVRYPALASHY